MQAVLTRVIEAWRAWRGAAAAEREAMRHAPVLSPRALEQVEDLEAQIRAALTRPPPAPFHPSIADVVLDGEAWECLIRDRTVDHLWAICRPRGSIDTDAALVPTLELWLPMQDSDGWIVCHDWSPRHLGEPRTEQARMALMDYAADVLQLPLRGRRLHRTEGEIAGWERWTEHRAQANRPPVVPRHPVG